MAIFRTPNGAVDVFLSTLDDGTPVVILSDPHTNVIGELEIHAVPLGVRVDIRQENPGPSLPKPQSLVAQVVVRR